MPDTIFLSNDRVFHTIEGEGINIGKPSVFMRMAMCNLTCSGWASPENPDGCDSKVSWIVKNKFTFEDLFKYFEERNLDTYLKRGDILKLTGGEPFLQERALNEWCGQAINRWQTGLRIEFETNCTLVPKCNWRHIYSPFAKFVADSETTYVCSPKLSNNGDPEHKRYNPEALEWHANSGVSTFKFVVQTEKDIDEILTKYVKPFSILPSNIWLMPECATTAQFKETAPAIAELCKRDGFNFSTRLQIMIWEKALGV